MGKFCGKCGSRLDEETSLCPICDAGKIRELSGSFSKELPHQKTKEESKKASGSGEKKNHVLKIVMICVALAVLFAFGAVAALTYFDVIDIPFIGNLLKSDKTEEWQEQYDLGVRFLADGNYKEAVIAFEAAIEIEPKNADAYLKLAETYVKLGDEEAAKDVLRRGIDAAEESDLLTEKLNEISTSQVYQEYIECPDDAVQFNGNNYYLYNFSDLDDSTWENALSYCQSQGGHLAVISSDEENDFLYQYMKSCGYDSAYFGLSKDDQGIWRWCNGEISNYSNWCSGEPDEENLDENYAMFYYEDSDGSWDDGDFGINTENSGSAFLCEWDHPSEQPSKRTSSDERDVVLVLDMSGSMSGIPLDETKEAAHNFIDTVLEEDASIGLVTYDNTAAVLSDFSTNWAVLTDAVSKVRTGGGTNIEAGLAEAHSMLNSSGAKKKIIVLMSDGEPNDGKEGNALIEYADQIKNDGITIYTLGFFEALGSSKSSAQTLMEGIASGGCHYEVANADDLVFFFEDMAYQINGRKYIYVRIACPVDVAVSYQGETLNSREDELITRTSFGTLTFEESENGSDDNDDRTKVLRLKEGTDYDVKIVGNGYGMMDYTIGFMDDAGEYSDLRTFQNVKITKCTVIDTVAKISDSSTLNVDSDGDGRYDIRYSAKANSLGEEVRMIPWRYVILAGSAVLLISAVVIIVSKKRKKHKEGIKEESGMPKYCGNCGARLDDGAKVCGSCGTPLECTSAPTDSGKNQDLQKQEKASKKVKKILVGILMLAVAVIVIKGITLFTGPKGLVRKAMSAYKSYDIEALTDMASDMYFYYDGMDDFVEYYFEYNVGNDLDYYEDAVGHNYKLSYEVNEIYKVSGRRLSGLLDNISYEYGDFDASSIKKIMIADVTVTAKSGKKTVNNDLQITLSKERSGWKILYME